MFPAGPLSIIRSFSLYTQQWYMSYRFAESLRTGSGRSFVLILLIITDMIGVDVTASCVLRVQCLVQVWQRQEPAAAT